MNSSEASESQDVGKSPVITRKRLLRKFWPLFLVQSSASMAIAGLMLNMLSFSLIIWPNDPFHALELGILVSVKLILLAIMGLVFGIFVDKYSRKKIMIIALFIMAFAKFTNGFVPTLLPVTFPLFIVFYGFLGVGQGGIAPSIVSLSDDAVEQNARSRFFGLIESFRQPFMVIGMIFSALLIQIGLWRVYFWSTGLLLLVCAFVIMFALREPKRGVMQGIVLEGTEAKYDYRLNKETIKSTIFSPTNIIAFIEGLFTWVLFSVAVYLIYPYVQSPPHNISPVNSSILMIIFGIPGSIFGAIAFAKVSDHLAERNVHWRIYMIVASMVTLFVIIALLFFIPLPVLSAAEGNNILILITYPIFLIFGVLLFLLRAVLGIYHINQTPILQVINLPEAQGKISSWNQFLETLGFGIGPLISGVLLTLNQNYMITALVSLSIGIPSILLWMLAVKWLKGDINRVKSILKERAETLSQESNEN